MLIGNYSLRTKNLVRELSGGATGAGTNPADFYKAGLLRGAPYGWASESDFANIADKSANPVGYLHPYALSMPVKGGGMAASNTVEGAGSLTASIAGGRNMEAALAGTGDITDAAAALIVSAVAAITGSGTLSADISGRLDAVATLAGSGDIVASLQALANVVAALTGSGSVSTAQATATASMSANIVVTGDMLNTANVAAAVWNALAASFNQAGTMGAKMNAGGAGGGLTSTDVWQHVIEAGYTAEELLRILTAVLAGATTGGPSAPAYKSIDGSKTRVTGTADISGNRSGVSLDGDA